MAGHMMELQTLARSLEAQYYIDRKYCSQERRGL